jgi:hypothetical protein
MGADREVRLPPRGSLRLTGEGPTAIELHVSLGPLGPSKRLPPGEDSAAPGSLSSGPDERRWLRQVRLRDVEPDDAPVPEEPVAVYRDVLRDGETAAVRLTLRHEEIPEP